MNDVDLTAITRAVREMNAARNSYERAVAELQAALPADGVVLHRLPGESVAPEAVYWSYWKESGGSFGYSAGADAWGAGMRAFMIAAPAPREEFLPRLEDAR